MRRPLQLKFRITLIFAFWFTPFGVLRAADGPVGKPAEANPPNSLFILADDLGWGDLHCYGNLHLDTPALDALAQQGIRFTDHYSPSPLCAPARGPFSLDGSITARAPSTSRVTAAATESTGPS